MTHRLPDVETRMRRQPTLWDVAFAVRGTILPRIALHLLLISIVTAGAVLASTEHPGIFARFSAVPFTLIGIALSVFMSFRNNACYSRWWEARHLWGDLVIACRSIARQTSLLDPNSRAQILRGLCGFSAGLYSRLRRADEAHAIAPWWDIGKASQGPNPTDAVLQGIGLKLAHLAHEGRIDSIQYSVMDKQLANLARIQGGVREDTQYSDSILVFAAASPDCDRILHNTSFCAGRNIGVVDLFTGAHCGVHVFWSRCAGPSAGGAIQFRAERAPDLLNAEDDRDRANVNAGSDCGRSGVGTAAR